MGAQRIESAREVEEPQRLQDASRVETELESRYLLGMRVDATSYEDATERVIGWARVPESRFLCASSVNNVIEAHDDESFREVMNASDLDTPDGMPLVWGLKALGVPHATRTYGPTLTQHVCARAEQEGIAVGFFGGAPDVLDELNAVVARRWPDLEVAYSYSPPFRELSAEERAQIVTDINSSGARIIFVGLGTPKQDRWMAEHRGSVNAVMLGVGAAFDFIAGRKKQAPSIMQRFGLEWVFRLFSEPKRLWKRYLYRNPKFLVLFGAQVIRHKAQRRYRG